MAINDELRIENLKICGHKMQIIVIPELNDAYMFTTKEILKIPGFNTRQKGTTMSKDCMTTEQSQVDEQMNAIGRDTEALEVLQKELWKRLQKVVIDPPEEPSPSPDSSAPEQALVPLATHLRDYSRRLHLSVVSLRRLLEQIEL